MEKAGLKSKYFGRQFFQLPFLLDGKRPAPKSKYFGRQNLPLFRFQATLLADKSRSIKQLRDTVTIPVFDLLLYLLANRLVPKPWSTRTLRGADYASS